jgi:hypothetical protein
MASRVDYAVSATPVAAVGAAENIATETIAADVNKTIGGGGSVTVTWGATIPQVSSAYAPYVASGTSLAVDAAAVTLGAFTNAKFIVIKHTGYLFSSETVLGLVTAAKLKITMVATIANATTVAILNAGDAIILPYNVACTPTLFSAGDGVAVAVEVMATV